MSISREVLRKYITPNTEFIETGARWADTVIKAIELGAVHARSCELEVIQHAIAWSHLSDALPRGNWFLHQGSSKYFLKDYARFGGPIDVKYVVFLDAHTERHSPLLDELEEIRKWNEKNLTILIDDIRIVKIGAWGFTLDDVFKALDKIGPHEISYEPGVEPNDILVAVYK